MEKSVKGSERTTHKRNVIESSSESETDNTSNNCTPVRTRVSSRLSERRKRPSFCLPSRDTIWNEIPDLDKPITSLRELTPRKTVNDFTKVYNTYNYDDYEDTGDESAGLNTSSSDSDRLTRGKHRIKNYHFRVKCQDGNSSSDSEDTGSSKRTKSVSESLCKDNDQAEEETRPPAAQSNDSADDLNFECASEDNRDSDEIISPRKKKKKRGKVQRRSTSLLVSDSSEDESTQQCGDISAEGGTKTDSGIDHGCSLRKGKKSSCSKGNHQDSTGTSVLDGGSCRRDSQSRGENDQKQMSQRNYAVTNVDCTNQNVNENFETVDSVSSDSSDDSEQNSCGDEESQSESEDKNETRSDLLKRKKEKEKSFKFKELISARKRLKTNMSTVASASTKNKNSI